MLLPFTRPGEWLSALSDSLPDASVNYTFADALRTAVSSAAETGPPRLRVATSPAAPLAAT